MLAEGIDGIEGIAAIVADESWDILYNSIQISLGYE